MRNMIEYKDGRYICPFGHKHESRDDADDCVDAWERMFEEERDE